MIFFSYISTSTFKKQYSCKQARVSFHCNFCSQSFLKKSQRLEPMKHSRRILNFFFVAILRLFLFVLHLPYSSFSKQHFHLYKNFSQHVQLKSYRVFKKAQRPKTKMHISQISDAVTKILRPFRPVLLKTFIVP